MGLFRLTALLCCAFSLGANLSAQSLRFQYLFTVGSEGGLNPFQKYSLGLGRIFFGRPERLSALRVPTMVTVDGRGRIWITDRGTPAVHMFGVFQDEYKILRGGGKTDFGCPWGIDIDARGRIYVSDACLGQIFVFDQEGEFLRFLVGRNHQARLDRPKALAVSDDIKTIYVVDEARHRVVALNQEGETVREWGGTEAPDALKEPSDLAVDNERVLVLDAHRNRVEAFGSQGNTLERWKWNQVRKPSAFAFDAQRRLFFVGDARYSIVHVFSEEGFPVGIFGQYGSGSDEFQAPSSIYADSEGRVYVVDSLYSKVLVFRHHPDNAALLEKWGRGEAPGRLGQTAVGRTDKESRNHDGQKLKTRE